MFQTYKKKQNMSKILTFAIPAALLILSSCGGWSEDQKTAIKNKCIGNGGYDCDCYVETIVKAHPSTDEFNKLSADEKKELLKGCEKEIEEVIEEELESF